nr:hypothetical protein [Alicyclobacillus sp. SO9]
MATLKQVKFRRQTKQESMTQFSHNAAAVVAAVAGAVVAGAAAAAVAAVAVHAAAVASAVEDVIAAAAASVVAVVIAAAAVFPGNAEVREERVQPLASRPHHCTDRIVVTGKLTTVRCQTNPVLETGFFSLEQNIFPVDMIQKVLG